MALNRLSSRLCAVGLLFIVLAAKKRSADFLLANIEWIRDVSAYTRQTHSFQDANSSFIRISCECSNKARFNAVHREFFLRHTIRSADAERKRLVE